MGSRTDADIAAWQEAAGIKPAQGARLDALEEMSRRAFDLIRVIELEKSGIRDGAGYWVGGDALDGTVRDIVELLERLEAMKMENGEWHQPSPAATGTHPGRKWWASLRQAR